MQSHPYGLPVPLRPIPLPDSSPYTYSHGLFASSPDHPRITLGSHAVCVRCVRLSIQFRAHVEALGVEVSSASEIDALFDELDADGGGSLDAAEVKRALRVLQEEAEAAKVSKRSLCEQTIIACRAAKAALASFRTRKEAEEAAAAEEASKAALAAERVAVAAAEAKAARERAMEEKRAEAAAAAAAFKAKVEEKRLKRG